MKSVTIEQVIAWEPCGLHDDDDGKNYTPDRIDRLFAGREALAARDITALDIPVEDKLWALLQPEFLTDHQMHELACDFAETVLHLCGDDQRPRLAVQAKRAWLRGEISDDELDAARTAAYAASAAARTTGAGAAAWAAARATGAGAAAYAAWSAAYAAGEAGAEAYAAYAAGGEAYAAWGAQIERVLSIIDGN